MAYEEECENCGEEECECDNTHAYQNFNDLNEAIKNYEYKKEGGKYYDAIKQEEIDTKEPENHWIFIRYKNRIYYDFNSVNPNENDEVKEEMIENIRRAVLEWETGCEIHDHDQ